MGKKVNLHYLKGRTEKGYTTFGMIWEKGSVTKEDYFRLMADDKEANLQSRMTAYWPDGSIKWTSHTAYLPDGGNNLTIECIGENDYKNINSIGIKISTTEERVKVKTKKIEATFLKKGSSVISDLVINGRQTVVKGELIALLEKRSDEGFNQIIKTVPYTSQVQKVELEEVGPLRAVIKVSGMHYNAKEQRNVLPFILRFTFHDEDEAVGIMHTFLYDGDPDKDYLKGLGLQLDCPLQGEAYNRHIKLGGDYGYFSEALQMLLSWRPKLREGLYEEQIEGKLLSFDQEKEPEVFKAIDSITVWGNYHLTQDHAKAYSIKKRTEKECCTYIHCMDGRKAKGIVAISGEKGGMGIAMRDFWQKYPSSLWLDDLTQETAKVTAWFWSPEVEAMDFRHYDTVGHEGSYYEGFNEVKSTPYSIANTSELMLYGFNGTMPEDSELDEWVQRTNKPSLLIATPEYYHQLKAFGTWSLVNKATPLTTWLENQIDNAIEFYKKEIETRGWYGYFNYGDVMHTYDKVRHCWRYDMGGYAWQNTELVPTLWLWYTFLRTGREDIYTLAEAMSRHCSEVDMYHLGDYKGIGSRHNVIHWGCSCKEPRIAMAGHHRIFYYLTGDYRMEDIFEEVKDGDFSTLNIDPLRHFYDKEKMVYKTHARTGPDWSSYCSNWMTRWERKHDQFYKEKLLVGIEDIKKSPMQLISGSDYEYDPATGHLRYIGENAAGGMHLVICLGAAQTWLELADLLGDPEWNKMIADFGLCYFSTKEERRILTNGLMDERVFGLPYMISAMGAFGARFYDNKELAKRVWHTLIDALWQENGIKGFETEKIEPYIYENTLEEISWISTNFASQWCLNVIYCLELIPEVIPEIITEVQDMGEQIIK